MDKIHACGMARFASDFVSAGPDTRVNREAEAAGLKKCQAIMLLLMCSSYM